MKKEFKECSICSEKPGSPTLCSSCLTNRMTIGSYKNDVNFMDEKFKALSVYFNCNPQFGWADTKLIGFYNKTGIACDSLEAFADRLIELGILK